MAASVQPQILERIVRAKRVELQTARKKVPLSELERRIATARREFRQPGRFRRALEPSAGQGSGDCAVIAELKKASPSKGLLRESYDPPAIARRYQQAGARALSVLTDGEFFQGSLEHLEQVRAAVSLPLLRKDFTLEEYSVYEAAAAGADAILLIVAILKPQEISRLLDQARALGLDALVEVHTREELHVAIDAGSEIIGVNNRNLKTFEVSLDTSFELIEAMPDHAVAVSESGLRSGGDLRRLREAGFDAFLIGERFMSQADPGEALERLLAEAAGRTAVKDGEGMTGAWYS